MNRKVIGPFNRVEGDLEVQLEIQDGVVADAWVVSPLYRGFERMLLGKHPEDALVFTPRICGICSVSQSIAAAKALAMAKGLTMPENGRLAQNIILAAENVADHLTHFYLFFMPDFCRPTYAHEPWYEAIEPRFKAVKGTAMKEMLKPRSEFMHILGLLAGKWPHSLALQPGGVTKTVGKKEQLKLLTLISAFRQFLEGTLFGCSLHELLAVKDQASLYQLFGDGAAATSDFGKFLRASQALQLQKLGKGPNLFLSYGVYDLEPDDSQRSERFYRPGTVVNGVYQSFSQEAIFEDVSHSWMSEQKRPLHPFEGATQPDAEQGDGYSWCKAPRLAAQPAEVGALARQVVNGHPLFEDLTLDNRGNVEARIVARLYEIAETVTAMEAWAKEIQPNEPICAHGSMEQECQGFGLVEAARGSLGHWVKIKKGRILNYQIIAPTTWNFSPRDGEGVPGPLEKALVGATFRDDETDQPASVQHIVRSFDPCMVCTVH